MNSIKIKIGRLEDAVDLAHQIPEFDNPYNIDEYKIEEPERLLDILSKNNMVESNGEAKRLIKQGAIKIGVCMWMPFIRFGFG